MGVFLSVWCVRLHVFIGSSSMCVFVRLRFFKAAIGAVCQKTGSPCQSGEDGAAVWTHPCSPQGGGPLHWPGVYAHAHDTHHTVTCSTYGVCTVGLSHVFSPCS